jgi:hypothetical protein
MIGYGGKRGNFHGRSHFGNYEDEKLVLKWILEKYVAKVLTEFK